MARKEQDMTDLRDAARQALEALEAGAESWRLIGPAIDALRAALEQPEQCMAHGECFGGLCIYPSRSGQPEQPVQEPVAWRTFDGEGGYDYRTYDDNENYRDEWDRRNPNHKGWVEPLYTHPPRREWQFLSAEERYRIADESASTIVAVLATEAALKEKNHE
jgi:hypothetical protein